ncbi:MAG: ATP-binding cassette domain-containing protein, partial [Delftia sp.]|nr:ATP-binding cassette domain-containing protein [Delftia sp.]
MVRLFGRRQATLARAEALSEQLAQANLATIRLRSGLQPVYTLLMMTGIVFVIWLGGERVAAGTMSLGAFVAYLDLYRRFVGRGHRIPQLFNSVQSAGAAFARLEPLLAPPLARREPRFSSLWISHIPVLKQPIPPLPPRPAGPLAVSLQGVTFRFPGNDAIVLDDVSLEIAPGTIVAVTGPVGSGKSALARTLLGLYPLAAGRVLLGDKLLDSLSQPERAARIGYLPQTPFLFSGTIRENILPHPASENGASALERYVPLAALQEDVQAFPHGLDTEIGERGVRVSGGQRQRVALARALATNPGLLVLDDPFSAVDVDTEARIIAGLHASFGPAAAPEQQATIVFFSHRLAAFPLADLVVVLQGGRII